LLKEKRLFFQRVTLGLFLFVIAALLVWPGSRTESPQPITLFAFHEPETPEPSDEPSDEGFPPDYDPAPDGIPFWGNSLDIIGINDIIYQSESGFMDPMETLVKDALTPSDTEKLHDFEYLTRQFYIIESNTGLLPADIDVSAFLKADLSLDTGIPGPKVLIFHTHSTEMFADSRVQEAAAATDPMEGVMGAGRHLAGILTQRYGVEVLHHTGRYDIVDGKAQISGAYERMEPVIRQILAANPSIQLVIDLHRDGLREGVPPMVTDINGKPAARIMRGSPTRISPKT
jgi:stage II sporulation protein P